MNGGGRVFNINPGETHNNPIHDQALNLPFSLDVLKNTEYLDFTQETLPPQNTRELPILNNNNNFYQKLQDIADPPTIQYDDDIVTEQFATEDIRITYQSKVSLTQFIAGIDLEYVQNLIFFALLFLLLLFIIYKVVKCLFFTSSSKEE